MITPADEGRHDPGPEELWNESWYFDFAAEDGSFGGYVRLGLYPRLGTVWWWAYLVGDGRPLVAVRDHEVPMPTGKGLELRTEGLWAEATCETPNEHWSIGMEAFGVALDDPGDAYRGERGERVPVGLDLEWEAAGPVYEYPGVTRYEQACTVSGEVLIGDERIEFSGPGERDHSWGVRDWWSFGWVWTSGQFPDGAAFHAARIELPGGSSAYTPGFDLAGPSAELETIDGFTVDTDLGVDDLPTAARMQLGPHTLDVTPLHHAPIRLDAPDGRSGRFPRSLCRYVTPDGRTAVGWTEWNQPQR